MAYWPRVLDTACTQPFHVEFHQRDAWQERAQELERTRDYLSKRRDELFDEGRAKDRKIIALRGVITRMKNNARPGAGDEREA